MIRRIESLTDSLHDPENDSQIFARFGLKQAIIIEPDESEANQLESVLVSSGIGDIRKFHTGSAAWNYLGSIENPPGLIITEWRLQGVSGMKLCQRICKHWPNIHILVHSSLLQSGDRLILRELGVSDLIEKPKGLKALRQALLACMMQRVSPATHKQFEARVRQLVAAGRMNEAASMLSQAEQGEKIPETLALALRAEILYAQGQYAEAARVGRESLQQTGDNINLINLLGKVYLKLQDFTLAEKFLQKAADLSPNNVERVCMLAETKAEMKDTAGATKTLDLAANLDEESETIIETKAKIALIDGDSGLLNSTLHQVGNSDQVVRFMNNRGVLLSKSEKFKECIKLYTTALKGLPPSLEHLKPVVAYNLGLALVKTGDLKRAVTFLQFAVSGADSAIQQKAASLKARASDALKKGGKVTLSVASEKEIELHDEPTPRGESQLFSSTHYKAGEACLHHI